MIIETQKTEKTSKRKYLFLFTGKIEDRRSTIEGKNAIFFYLGNKTQYRQFA